MIQEVKNGSGVDATRLVMNLIIIEVGSQGSHVFCMCLTFSIMRFWGETLKVALFVSGWISVNITE